MVVVNGLRLPAAWRSVQVDNPSFEISADELNIFNELESDANIDWQTVIQDNIIALDALTVSADAPSQIGLVSFFRDSGGPAVQVPGTQFGIIGDAGTIATFTQALALLTTPLDLGTNLINNVVDPVGAQDAATRNYVDTTTNLVTASNVGAGTGDIFRDKTGTTINLRTLLAGTNISISTAGDEVTITNTGVGVHNLLSATHPDTVPASPPAQGSLVKGNGSSLWAEFTLGAALQVLRVNAGGTDLEYFTVAGVTDELVNLFEAGVQVGAVARQLNFSNADDFGITEDGGNNRFDIAISRNVADGIAGLDASSRLAKANQHSATVYNDQNNAFGSFFQDFDNLATPANPSAGTRRLFVDSGTGEISVRTSGGATVSLEGGGGGDTVIGTQQFGVGSQGIYPGITNSANAIAQREAGTFDQQVKYIAFPDSDTVDATAYLDWFPPQNWNAGTVRVKLYWTSEFPSVATETIEIEVSAVARSNDDAIGGVDFGTPVAITDTFILIDDTHITSQSGAITIAGTPAKFDWVQFKFLRDVSADTLQGEVQIVGAVLEYTIDAGTSVG